MEPPSISSLTPNVRLVTNSYKILSPLVILSKEKTMVARVISGLT